MVRVSGVIGDAHLIPLKFCTEGRQPLKIFYNAVALNAALMFILYVDNKRNDLASSKNNTLSF